ncbi:MAG: hypothetical protein ABDH31_07440 [Chlorobiota bacterium]
MRWVLTVLLPTAVFARSLVGEGATVETTHLITVPTAGLLPRGSLLVRAGIFPQGTLAVECFTTPLSRFMVGIGFSASNLIGSGAPQWQPFPGISLRFRALEETTARPALVFGVHTQGWGSYRRESRQFTIAASGLFTALSKSYRWWLGETAWHLSLGYPLELPPRQRRPGMAVGWEHTIARLGQLSLEYVLLGSTVDGRRQGILSLALRLGIAPTAAVGVSIVDVLRNSGSETAWARALSIEWHLR